MPDPVKARLADLASRLLARPDAPPGAVLALGVADRDDIHASGLRSVRPDSLPMTADTSFDLGSVTKVVGTTTMLMSLVSSGRLSLSRDLEVLLRHRAGLWEWWPLYACPGDPLDAVRALPLRYEADSGRHYSDLGFMLLGSVISSVTGLGLAESFTSLVSGPFGLSETSYAGPAGTAVAAGQVGDEIERRMVRTGQPYPVPVAVEAFTGWRSGVLAGSVGDGNAFHCFDGVAGHAGLFSTASDLLRWGRGLLASSAGAGPLDAEVVERFWAAGPDDGQRLGFRSRSLGRCTAYEHPGFPGAGVAVVPSHAATVVLLTNRLHRPGAPPPFEPWWAAVLDDVHDLLQEESPCG